MKAKKQPIDQSVSQSPDKIIELETKVSALESRLARALADYQNQEKRFARESSSVIKFANANLLEKLLEIRDHISSASNHLQDASLTMILSSLDKLLSDEGVVPVDCSGTFDPTSMECQEIVTGVKDQVVSVVRPGYKLNDRLLRAARVNVGDGSINTGSPKDNKK